MGAGFMENRGFKTSEVRVVEASAGSGKTYALARRYVKLLLAGGSPELREPQRSILAITFSNKAAVEMKGRILDLLKKIALDGFRDKKEKDSLYEYLEAAGDLRAAASAAVDGILARYNFLQVQTIDSFINAVLSGCAFRLDISPSFHIKDDFRRYIAYGFDRMVDAAASQGKERDIFLRFLKQYIYLENRKSWIPRKDIISIISGLFEKSNSYGLPLLKYPKDPSGLIEKRRNIFELMLQLKPLLPEEINRVTWGTFIDKLSPDTDLMKIEKFWGPFSKDDLRMRKGARASAESEELWKRIKDEIAEYCEWSAYSRFNCYIDIFEGVRKNLAYLANRENVLFLHELNSRLHSLWEEGCVDVPELYYRLATRYRHFLIDEFQDTSVIQWQNLMPMAEEALSNGGSLFLVGDRKQGIYRFRGGDTSLMRKVPEAFSQFNIFTEVLNRNYRSSRAVVEFNNYVFSGGNLMKFLLSLSPEEGIPPEAGPVPEIFANAGQEPAIDPGMTGYVSVETAAGRNKEECSENIRVRVLEIIAELRSSGRFACSDIALLCRSNSEAGTVTSWLLEEGVPVESEKTLNIRDNALVKEIISLLKFLNSPVDNLSFASFLLGRIFPVASGIPAGSIRGFFFRLASGGERARESVYSPTQKTPGLSLGMNAQGEREGIKRGTASEEFRSSSRETPGFKPGELHYYREFQKEYPQVWKDLFEPFFKNVGLMPLYEMSVDIISRFSVTANFPGESGFVCGLLEIIKESEPECQGSPGIFLEWFANMPADKLNLHIPASGSVKVLTIHKSKGLEFPVVIIPFLEFRFKVGSRSAEGSDAFVYNAGSDAAHLVHLRSAEGVEFSPALKELYLREYYKAVGDELCAAYVACTRAACELYVIIPLAGAKKTNPAVDLLPAGGYTAGQRGEYRAHKEPSGTLLSLSVPRYGDWMGLLREEFPSGEELRNREAISEGELLHRLLSAVGISGGGSAPEEELDSASAALEDEPLKIEKARKKAMALLEAPATSWIFRRSGARVYCEKEIVMASGRSLRIDRLIEEENKILVVDYKSSRSGREGYLRQMKEYIGAAAGMYPGRQVSGVIVYMDSLETEAVRDG